MTGLEPHPILEYPPLEWANDPSREADLQTWFRGRAQAMEAERLDPLSQGWEPEIWHIVDDLLCDGHKIILDVSRLEKIGAQVDTPLEMEGRAEVWIAGSNRSSKSEYAAKKMMKVLTNTPKARTWSFADTGPISRARQQPLFWKYMPAEVKRLAAGTGKTKRGAVLNISWGQKGGFTEETFVLQNAAQHWFKNYEQDDVNVEGDQLDAIWLDELRNVDLLKTLRGRMGDRGGLLIVTFTSINENFSAVVNEYERGAITKLEVPAVMLPIKKPKILRGGVESRHVRALPENGRESRQPTGAESEIRRSGGSAPPAQPISAGNNCVQGTSYNAQKDPEEPGSPAGSLIQPNTSGGTVAPENRDTSESAQSHAGGVTGAGMAEEWEIIGYKKVPRLKIAGKGSDGNQRANIVYFHITDNPYYGYEDALRQYQRTGNLVTFGEERFYRLYRGATEGKIKSRVYGLLEGRGAQQFPKFNDLWHMIAPGLIPAKGTNYLIVDPCDGRNWFMLWIRIIACGWWYVYREWPSHGHPGAYIPGIGDPDVWTLPGQAADGVRGPAQNAFGFGLDRYKQEILRNEGHREPVEALESKLAAHMGPEELSQALKELGSPGEKIWWRRVAKRPAILQKHVAGEKPPVALPAQQGPEEIHERWMDCRYANTPTLTREGRTTLLEQMDDLGMTFLSAPTEGQILGNETGSIHLINDMLDYDEEVERGVYSPRMARLNYPKLYISENCPNLLYSMREWTGRDKGHGACKDPIDDLRYATLAGLEYVGEGAYAWVGGGSY